MTVSFELSLLFAFAVGGIVWGFLYEICLFFRFALFKSKIVTVVTDFVFGLCGGAIFCFVCFRFAFGEIRLFMLLAFVTGFVLERTTTGNLIGRHLDAIYEFFSSLFRKIAKTKPIQKIFK